MPLLSTSRVARLLIPRSTRGSMGFIMRLMDSLAEARRLEAERFIARHADLLSPDYVWRRDQ